MPKGYFISPRDLKVSASKFSSKVFKNVHRDQISSWQLLGPKWYYDKWGLGNLESDKLSVSVDTYKPGGGSEPHAHPDWEQSLYIVTGRASVTVEGQTHELDQGNMALFPAGVEHHFTNLSEENLTVLVITVFPNNGELS